MEIIKLEFQGIGPFTDHNVIDFRELGRSGLFLLEGPTGSGKTTILDAIVFALYGDVSGEDSSKQRIVSTLLRADREPFVELVVDSSRGLLRVRRTPEFERPKLRGQGTTTNKATIKLWKLTAPDDPEGSPVSTSIAEADDELKRAIGLTKAQFTQTVLLPQGHFATFLRAKPEDRRDVLQEIFGTELYARFANKLAEMAKAHRASLESAAVALYEVASNFCQVAWYDDAAAASDPIPEQVAFDAARDESDLESLRRGAQARSAALTLQLIDARAGADEARTVHQRAAEGLRQAASRNQLIHELNDLTLQRAKLSEREAAIILDEALLAAAEQAEHARRLLLNRDNADAALREAKSALHSAVQVVMAGPHADLANEGMSPLVLQTQEETARLGAGLLVRLAVLEENLNDRTTALARERAAQVDEDARIAEGLDQVTQSRQELDALGQQAMECHAVSETLSVAVERHAAAQRCYEASREAERLSSLSAGAQADADELVRALEDCTTRHKDAHQAWLNSQAAELAATLVDGDPCMVCGSEVHPSPATKPEGAIEIEIVETLAEAVDEARRRADGARATSEKLAGRVEQQVALSLGVGVAEAAAELAAAELGRREGEKANRELAAIRGQIDAITRTAQSQEVTLREDAANLAARRGILSQTEKQLEADRAEIAAGAGDFSSVRMRQEALTARAETARRLSSLLQTVGVAEQEDERCDSELSEVLAERGFMSGEAALAAMLPDAERSRIRAAVDTHKSDVASVDAQLVSGRYEGLAGATPEDLTPLVLTEQETDALHSEAERRCGAIKQTVNAAALAAKDLDSRIQQLELLREQSAPLVRMANLANGAEGNLQRVTLAAYVLLRRFEEVVDVANVRLDAMTGGRYELRRTDEQEGRSKKLGLGLEVIDHQARDTTRAPRTLSGGETFMASLALALGLAESVTAEAGGIQLHTLFVDEGFGSLDPDTLDAVMQQLTALRAGGRCVGVVSHVTEMKQRISERITVVPRHDGTSTLTCTATTAAAAV